MGTLGQCIGLLIWATSIALLRSWLAPLYSDLNSPPGLMRLIPPQMWSAFRASLNKDLKTSHSLPGLSITVAPKFWKFQVAPCTALRTSRGCPALANPRGCASRTPITHILAFPSQASNASHGRRYNPTLKGVMRPAAQLARLYRGCLKH